MSNYIDMGHKDSFPSVGAIPTDDGEVILSIGNYPCSATMCVPMSVAVELATRILCMANKQLKEAA